MASLEAGERYRSDDWLTNVISIPRSLTLKRIKYHLGANLLVTALVMLLRAKGVRLATPPIAHTLVGGFLGLLLVFRTNAAYARFWEARYAAQPGSRMCEAVLACSALAS